MDRNFFPVINLLSRFVALRKESVDRNLLRPVSFSLLLAVALRKESVDRNKVAKCRKIMKQVALRKESVDRNSNNPRAIIRTTSRSPQGERG